MINNDRIVPVTKIDLITLYGNIMVLAGTSVSKCDAINAEGDFVLETGSGNLIASEPVKSFDFGADVSAAVVYFIPTYDYVGFSIDGTAVEVEGVDVNPNGVDLYTATLSDSTVTIAKVGF